MRTPEELLLDARALVADGGSSRTLRVTARDLVALGDLRPPYPSDRLLQLLNLADQLAVGLRDIAGIKDGGGGLHLLNGGPDDDFSGR